MAIPLRVAARTVPIRLAGEIGEDALSWFNRLCRHRFELVVQSGRVAEIKLRCDCAYLFFRYEPDVRYTVEGKPRACRIEVVGDPGTKFELVQL